MNAGNNGKARKKSGGRQSGRTPKADNDRPVRSFVGKWRYGVSDVAKEFLKLGLDDEKAGRVLMKNGQQRQAIYFFVQAMEKFVRFGIFSEVSASDTGHDGQTYRERTLTHALDELLAVLLEVFTEAIDDPRVSEQIEEQLKTHVLEGERFGQLHNNIRYPRYMWKSGDFSVLQLSDGDVQKVVKKLERLKSFVAGFAKLKGETSLLEPHLTTSVQPKPKAKSPPKKAEQDAKPQSSADKLAEFRF